MDVALEDLRVTNVKIVLFWFFSNFAISAKDSVFLWCKCLVNT